MLKSKILKATIALTLVLTNVLYSGISFALSCDKPSKVLIQYLTALEKKDSVKAASLSKDLRVDGDENKEIEFLNGQFQDPNYEINSFNVLQNQVTKNESQVILIAEISYKNGKVEQSPILLENKNNNWTIIIDSDAANKDLVVLKNKGNEIIHTPEAKSSCLTSWAQSQNMSSDRFYTSTFTSTATVVLTYEQWAVIPSNGTAKYNYSIVQKGYFYDTTYANGNISINNNGSPKTIALYPGIHSNVCVKGYVYSWDGGNPIGQYNYSYGHTN